MLVKKIKNSAKHTFKNIITSVDNPAVDMNSEAFLKMLGYDANKTDVSRERILFEAVSYACIRIRSEAVAKVPIKIYKGNKKDEEHYLNRILRLRPNPYMSAFTFKKLIETNNCIHGNAYAYIDIDRRTGRVKGLYPLENARVTIYVDDVGLLGKANNVYYIYSSADGKRYKLNREEIFHAMGLTFNGIVGIPPWMYLQGIVENSKASQEYMNQFYKNGLQTKGIIQYVGDLNEDSQKTFRREFENMSSGLNNAHRISLLPIGYSYTPISSNMVDAQFIENSKLSAQQIAAAYGVKLHQINMGEKSTYSNVEQAQKDFYIETMQPIFTGYEQELDYLLFLNRELDEGYSTKFNVDVILRSDPKTRAETNKLLVEGGLKSPNEARDDEDLPPLDGGDMLLGNGNLIPLKMAGLQYISSFSLEEIDGYINALNELKEVKKNG